MIELHTRLNPNQITFIYAKDISAIEPSTYGSGANVTLKSGHMIEVSETPLEVNRLKREQQ